MWRCPVVKYFTCLTLCASPDAGGAARGHPRDQLGGPGLRLTRKSGIQCATTRPSKIGVKTPSQACCGPMTGKAGARERGGNAEMRTGPTDWVQVESDQ